jgi:hypothetical protein
LCAGRNAGNKRPERGVDGCAPGHRASAPAPPLHFLIFISSHPPTPIEGCGPTLTERSTSLGPATLPESPPSLMAASPPPLPVAHFSNNTHEPSSSPPYSSSRSTVLAVSSRAALKTKTCAVFSRYTQVDTRGHDRAAAQNFCTVLRLLLTTVLKPLSDA